MTFLYKTYAVEYEYLFDQHSKTILLLHGWGGNKDSFVKVKKVFKSQFNILSLSFPPSNIYQQFKTSNSINPLDMYDYKNLILDLLKLLNINSVIIICHSFGFRVALMLSTTNIVIEKLIITGGAGIKLKQNLLKKLEQNFHTILLKSHPEFFTNFASKEYTSLSPVDRQTFKNIVNKNLICYIKNLPCPIFLFWGKKDTATPMKMFKIIKNFKPNISYKIIKNGSHFCYLNQSDLFIDCCQNFIENKKDYSC